MNHKQIHSSRKTWQPEEMSFFLFCFWKKMTNMLLVITLNTRPIKIFLSIISLLANHRKELSLVLQNGRFHDRAEMQRGTYYRFRRWEERKRTFYPNSECVQILQVWKLLTMYFDILLPLKNSSDTILAKDV